MDIHPVINHYKAIIYMCGYLSEVEDDCSHAITQVVKNAWDKSLNKYKQTRLIARAYATKRAQRTRSMFTIL